MSGIHLPLFLSNDMNSDADIQFKKNAIVAKHAMLGSFLFIHNCILPDGLAARHTEIRSDQY